MTSWGHPISEAVGVPIQEVGPQNLFYAKQDWLLCWLSGNVLKFFLFMNPSRTFSGAVFGTREWVKFLGLFDKRQRGSRGEALRYRSQHACLLSHFSRVRLCDPIDCSPPGSSVQGIFQARILEWVAMPSSRRIFQTQDPTSASYISCVGRQVLHHWCHLGSPQPPDPCR